MPWSPHVHLSGLTHTHQQELWNRSAFLCQCAEEYTNPWNFRICKWTFLGCFCFTTEDDKAEVSRFAKNFLPILFNIYSQEPTPGVAVASRMAVLDTSRVYLTITDQTVLMEFMRVFQCTCIPIMLLVVDLLSPKHVIFASQMVCTFLQKASERLGSADSSEFTR